jgi:hypothetical protein
MAKETGLHHCEICHKWHSETDMCFAKTKEHVALLEEEIANIYNTLLSGDLFIRELVSRQYNTKEEQLFFRKLFNLLREAKE